MERGYVKIWRKTLDTPIFKNHELFSFWCWCLMKASHKKFKVLVGLQMVELERGEFVFGRKKAALETGLSERKIRTCLKKLENFQNLTIKTTNKFSIISIINWDIYQQDKTSNDQQNDQQVTSKRPASDQQVTTNKNIKHIKNNKNKELRKYLERKIIENNFFEIKDHIFEFFTWRMTEKIKGKKQPYESEKGINGLFRNLNGCRDAGLIVSDCIEISMEKPWLTPDPSYFKNNNFNSNQNQSGGMDWLQARKAARARGDIE